MSRLFLIDGTALAYRSHFAFATSSRGGLSTRDGRATSAIYGFTTSLRALLDQEKPEHIAISFDGPRSALERTQIYPEYKSTREKAPDELIDQLSDIRKVVDLHGIPTFEAEGHEADDVIGTLAVRGREAGMEVFIVTGDKDFMQLVGDKVKLWNLRSSARAPEVLGIEAVDEKFGVKPEQMIDLLALMGDSSDNVPGVPRVGQKTAAKLLLEHGSLDAALENLDDVKPPSVKKALGEHRDQALLSRDLVTIRTDLDLDVDVSKLPGPTPDIDGLRSMFMELEFDTLVRSLPQPPKAQLEQNYSVAHDEAGLDDVIASMQSAGRFAVEIETTQGLPIEQRLVGIAFCKDEATATYVPLNTGLLAGRDAILERLKPLFTDASLNVIAHDTKRLTHVLLNHGIEIENATFDTLLASYCLSAGVGRHGLEDLALRYFDVQKTPQKDLLGTGKKQKTFEDLDVDAIGDFASEGADLVWRLAERMVAELDDLGVDRVFSELELPLVPVLLRMEREGIQLDTDHLSELAQELGDRAQQLEERIYERAGEPFNINSPSQIGEVLFGKLEVHKIANVRPRKTKTGQFKTDAAVLEKLAKHHEVPQLILDYRVLTKLKGTYVDTLPALAREGRVHTTFNQAIAATGRLSSEDPNLQNIPIRTDWGRKVRQGFVSRDKNAVLLSADYSQIELRILAHMAEDEGLCEAFQKGEDIHTKTAARVSGVMPQLVDPDQRSRAKVVNYGLIYGMGPSRLASETGMTPVEARKFIDAYFGAFPRVKGWLDTTLDRAREARGVRTLFGRWRPLPDIDANSVPLRVAAENMAVNTPIQGTAADIIKRAMLAVDAELAKRPLKTRMLLQVHDELVFDVPNDEVTEVTALVRECMENAADLAVPLEVSIGTGRDWLSAH